ncbi:MAG: EFR1 family ferrodoxin [Turicibacter sp.]
MNTIAYFSYTGNTKFLAYKLQSYLSESTTQVFNLAFDEIGTLKGGEYLVVMFAIHAFNCPQQVVDFAKNLPSKMFNQVHFIAVGCHDMWLNDAATDELRVVFENKGYAVGIDRVIAMPLTLMKKFPEDLGKTVVQQAQVQLSELANHLKQGSVDSKVVSFKAKSLNKVGKVEKHAAKLFGLELYANKDCISCGRCWKECPMKNIKPSKNQNPKFGFNCSMCMKCIYDCPTHAINPRLSKFIPIKDGYLLKDYLVE